MARVWERDAAQPSRASRSWSSRRSPRPGRRTERQRSPRRTRSVPLPAAAPAPAAAADDLRDIDAGRADDRRVLPGPAARRHPEPCAVPASLVSVGDSRRAAQREAARAPAAAARIARADPRQVALPPGALQHHRARARRRAGARHPDVRRRPAAVDLGSKTGCRRLFAEGACRTRSGAEDLHSVDEVVDAVVTMRASGPAMTQVIVKLNEGVSGEGNALVDLRGLPAPGSPRGARRARGAGAAMALEAPETPLDDLLGSSPSGGGIVEERIVGVEVRSPSVQLRVTPTGEVELLSTHDQLLGGPERAELPRLPLPGRLRLRPADQRAGPDHRGAAGAEGALGRFALDFVVVAGRGGRLDAVRDRAQPAQGRHDAPVPHAAVPHRRRATTPRTGAVPRRPTGREKHLVATDHLESPILRGLTVDDLFDIVARHGLHFDQSRQTGVVFHMISCLTEHGASASPPSVTPRPRPTRLTGGPSGSSSRRRARALQEPPFLKTEATTVGPKGHAGRGLIPERGPRY